MATVTIRNLPDEVHRALRLRAAHHGRSTEAEIRSILEAVARPPERIRLGSMLQAFTHKAGGLRALIEKIVLTPGPERGELYATLHGELRTIPEWTERQAIGKATKMIKPAAGATGLSVSVVAGARFQKFLPLHQGALLGPERLAA